MRALLSLLLFLFAFTTGHPINLYYANFNSSYYEEQYLGKCQSLDATCVAAISFYSLYLNPEIPNYIAFELPDDTLHHDHHFKTELKTLIISYSVSSQYNNWKYSNELMACNGVRDCQIKILDLKEIFLQTHPPYPIHRLAFVPSRMST